MRYVQDCHGLSWDVPEFICIYTSSPAKSLSRAQPPPHQKGVELHYAFISTPFTDGEGLWLLLSNTPCTSGFHQIENSMITVVENGTNIFLGTLLYLMSLSEDDLIRGVTNTVTYVSPHFTEF